MGSGVEINAFCAGLDTTILQRLGVKDHGKKPLLSVRQVNGQYLFKIVQYSWLDQLIYCIAKWTLITAIFGCYSHINKEVITASLRAAVVVSDVQYATKQYFLLNRVNQWYQNKGIPSPFALLSSSVTPSPIGTDPEDPNGQQKRPVAPPQQVTPQVTPVTPSPIGTDPEDPNGQQKRPVAPPQQVTPQQVTLPPSGQTKP